MKTNESANKEYQAAMRNIMIGAVCFGAGVGATLVGTTNFSGEPGVHINLPLMILGDALLISSIPLLLKSNKRLKRAVDIYNDGLQSTCIQRKTDFSIALTENGVGVIMKF